MAFIGKQETSEIISPNSYFGTLLLGTLPIAGDIMLYRWSKSSEVRENKQNLCKAYMKLKFMLLYPVLFILVAFIVVLILN